MPSTECYKVCLSGKFGVGKTTLFQRVAGRSSTPRYGTAEHTYSISYYDSQTRATEHLNVRLMDTAGVERHSSLTPSNYYRDCSCIVFVYDVTCMDSLHYITREFNEIQERELCDSNVKIVVLRNKVDVPKIRVEVSEEIALEHLKCCNSELSRNICCQMETSGESGHGVEKFFNDRLKWVLEDLQLDQTDCDPGFNIGRGSRRVEQDSPCCGS